MAATALLTADDLLRMPDDGKRRELVRGELIEMSPVNFEHFSIVGLLMRLVGTFVSERELGIVGGEGGFTLEVDPDTVLAPDVAFVHRDRLPPRDQWSKGFPELAPDLAVEVLSPGDTAAELNDKVLTYLDAGVKRVWLVDPKRRTVTTVAPDRTSRILREGETLDGEDVLPGFSLAVAEIFA